MMFRSILSGKAATPLRESGDPTKRGCVPESRVRGRPKGEDCRSQRRWEVVPRLAGTAYRFRPLNDDDIAVKLDLTEAKVPGCIAGILHFLKLKNRQELVLYALTAA